MISTTQILLARTLLGLSQVEMAEKMEIAPQTYAAIEKGTKDTPASRIERLQSFFEERGVEFMDGDGVRRSQVSTKSYSGTEGFRAFMDDVYETARDGGGEIILFNGVPGMLQKHLGADWYKKHAERMAAIQGGFSFKVTVREGDRNFIGSAFAKYKWFPEGLSSDRTIYVYGDKTAFLNFDGEVRILVIRQAEIADSMRVLFNIAWDAAAMEIPK